MTLERVYIAVCVAAYIRILLINMTNLEPDVLLRQWGGGDRADVSKALDAVSNEDLHDSYPS